MMEKQFMDRIQNAINYVEDHLYEKLEIENIAKAAFMSQSSFIINTKLPTASVQIEVVQLVR